MHMARAGEAEGETLHDVERMAAPSLLSSKSTENVYCSLT